MLRTPWLAVTGSFVFAIAGWTTIDTVTATDVVGPDPLPPEIADASDEPREAMAAIRLRDGWTASVWAAEPDIANVVAFDIDNQGRIYVCETFRQNRGVTDNRGHDQKWLLADLAAKTVQDRIDYHKQLLGEAAITYAQHDDRIRRISDTDGDGRADTSIVVADGFNHLEEGTGAGVLASGNVVYYTCIPKLWKLVDQDGDGKTDERVVLSDGYGVRVAFRGHDMHGLIRGYDGRLYFTIGDRGYHIRTAEEKILADPASGAVFRCEMDGTGLEVFARGLRNPQEIAFNDRGDWFSVDNNSDSGDRARIVHLLQDGDSGWRMYYQYLPDRGPFNRERIWEPANEAQPASIVPPVANFTDGPSGLAYYPGTGFGDQLDDTFLICDFRGGPSNSGIRSFKVSPKGATYELVSDGEPIWTCLATDVAFGPDGALYVSDWVDGWNGLGKARIYRIQDPRHATDPVVDEVRQLLGDDWNMMTTAQLANQLSHQDRRIRLHSQWELAQRGETDALAAIASDPNAAELSRLHAVWGLGHIARLASTETDLGSLKSLLIGLALDADQNISVAALKIAGELGWNEATRSAQAALASDQPRVRYAAIETLGRLKDESAMDPILKLATKTDREDTAIRHAAAMFLYRAAAEEKIASLSAHPSESARLIAVVALRRLRSSALSQFLGDAQVRVVLEAARAIHDEPIQFALPALARLIANPIESKPLLRRVLNANYRLGQPKNAEALAAFATRGDMDEAMRVEAITMLGDWAEPDVLDRVLGDYRPLNPRDPKAASDALDPQIDLLMSAPESVRLAAIDVASALGIRKISSALQKQVLQTTRPSESRGKALTALARLDPSAAVGLARELTEPDQRGPLGLARLNVLAKHAAESSIETFIRATSGGDTFVQQLAWDILAKIDGEKTNSVIAKAVQQYLSGELDPRVQLNVIQAAAGRLEPKLEERLSEFRASVSADDPLGPWLDSIAGGKAELGQKLFFGKTELSCVRCHKVDRVGGEVGPNLTEIGKQNDARYLLESICLPDAKIAKGYETTSIVDIDGRVVSGIVRNETDDFVELMLANGSQVRVSQDDIEARKKGKSSMPADLIKLMKPRELRDLVAYLTTLKADSRSDADVE